MNAREVRRREEQCAQDFHPEAFAETTFQVKSKQPCVADDDDDDGNSEADLHACVSVLKENEFALVDDQIEQDVVCAFSSSGWNVEEESRSGKCVHDELTRQHAKDMGVPVDKRVHSYRPSSQLQTDERRNKVQQSQERSACRACGQTGHSAGDAACCTGKDGFKGKDKAHYEGKKTSFRRSEAPHHRGSPTVMFAVVSLVTEEAIVEPDTNQLVADPDTNLTVVEPDTNQSFVDPDMKNTVAIQTRKTPWSFQTRTRITIAISLSEQA